MPHSVSPESKPRAEPSLNQEQPSSDGLPEASQGDPDAMDVSENEPLPSKPQADVKLEDLFPSDDDDDEFPSSAPTGSLSTKPASSSPVPDAA